MVDPTYSRKEIDANPEWRLAFLISEIVNDNAPLHWSTYIYQAECMIANGVVYTVTTKQEQEKE